MEKVTVIGGGNGAFATAADLTIRGNQVTLFELPRFAAGLSEVIEKGGIEMEAYASTTRRTACSIASAAQSRWTT